MTELQTILDSCNQRRLIMMTIKTNATPVPQPNAPENSDAGVPFDPIDPGPILRGHNSTLDAGQEAASECDRDSPFEPLRGAMFFRCSFGLCSPQKLGT